MCLPVLGVQRIVEDAVAPGLGDTWMPTEVLAQAAAHTLRANGAWTVEVSDGYARLPSTDRSPAWDALDRFVPIGRWYNADLATEEVAHLALPPMDAILTVGVWTYGYFGAGLHMEILAKLSNPKTKQVLGRAQCGTLAEGGPLAPLLHDNGAGMKGLIEATGLAMIPQCLTDLGLLRPNAEPCPELKPDVPR
jgi:hypothetical protein